MAQRSFKNTTLLAFLVFFCLSANAKKKIIFMSEDGVSITADLYFKDKSLPYVLMFHQDGSSRGEYNNIAKRIMSLEYNCLAVDLRRGGRVNYIENETAEYAKNNGIPNGYSETEKDIETAIEFAYKKSGKPVVLFGSSFSSSLCLKLALNNARISTVIAFDPGEFLKPGYVLKDNLHELDKPVFVATGIANKPYVKEMFSKADPKHITLFIPSDDKGKSGAKALWPESENNQEYWLSLLMFFSKL